MTTVNTGPYTETCNYYSIIPDKTVHIPLYLLIHYNNPTGILFKLQTKQQRIIKYNNSKFFRISVYQSKVHRITFQISNQYY